MRISLPEDPTVLLGMTASVSVKTDDAKPAFVLPLAALARQGDQAVVWLVDRQTETVKPRPVTVAGFAGDGVRVTDGLAAGDLVVAAGTQFMREDMKVRLYEAGMRSAQEPAAASSTQS